MVHAMTVDSRRADVRARMVRSAGLLFASRGHSATGLRDVVAHSATPRGSIYHHFPDGKAELARATMRQAADVAAAPFEGGGDDPVAALHTCLDGWRRALETSGFRAGSAIVAIAVEPDEQTG